MMNRPVKLTLYLVTFFICSLSVYIGLMFVFCETVFTPAPEIDTQFTSNFSKEHFESIKPGMIASQVENLLGQPFTRQGGSVGCWDGGPITIPNSTDVSPSIAVELPLYSEETEVWSYSKRGTFSWFKFAWLEYRVELHNSVVVKVEKCWSAV